MSENTERMARFITDVSYEMLPKEGIESAKQGILDCLGVALAACLEPGSRIITEYVRKEQGSAESGVIAGGFKAPASEAALANGTMSHMLDYDDVSIAFGGHPSVALLPTVLALGERLHCSGKEALSAYIAGFEVATRIALAYMIRHYDLGWHTTATFGTIGATAAAAKLLRLDVSKSRAALGIGASLAGGLKRNFGTMTKPFHAGCAARNGVVAARLAEQGFTADENIFDSQGSYGYVLSGGVEPNLDTQDLGEKFNICSGLEIKPYPSCRGTHGGIDAALQVKDKYAFNPADVAEVEYHVSPFIPLACFRHQPQTGLEGKFSVEFCAALCFLEGKVTLAQFTDEKVKSPAVQDLISKTKITVNPEIPKNSLVPVEIKVKLKSGKVLSQKLEAVKGEPRNPLSQEELFTKFRDCASVALLSKEVDKALELASNLETLKDITPLMEILTFRAKPR